MDANGLSHTSRFANASVAAIQVTTSKASLAMASLANTVRANSVTMLIPNAAVSVHNRRLLGTCERRAYVFDSGARAAGTVLMSMS